MRKLLTITTFTICILITSCGVLPPKNNFHSTNSSVELGVVGEIQNSIRKTTFQTFGNPKYNSLIRVSVSKSSFTSKLFKLYEKSLGGKDRLNKIVFYDTLAVKPTFVTVKIENKVAVVKALNESNTEVFNYLKKSPRAVLVNSLRLIPTQDFLDLLEKSDAIYLKTDKQTKQRLLVYKNEKEIGSTDVSKQVIFGYELASFCWKTTSRRKIEIATILNEDQNCSNTTKRNVEELEKELTKSSFKF